MGARSAESKGFGHEYANEPCNPKAYSDEYAKQLTNRPIHWSAPTNGYHYSRPDPTLPNGYDYSKHW
eukprot:267261-Heterocapsa_arctica.AAC.1